MATQQGIVGYMYSFKMGKNVLVGKCIGITGNNLVLQLPSGKTVNRKAGNCTIFVQLLQPANPANQPATVALPPKQTVVPQPQKMACRTQPMPAIAQKQAQAQLPTVLPAMAYTPCKYLLAKQQANLRKPNNGLTAIMAKIGAVPLPAMPALRIVGMAFMLLLLFVVLCGVAYTATATATATNMPKAKRAVNAMVSPLHNWPINSSPWF